MHLKDDDINEALREFKRVLIPKGIIFISLKEGTGEKEFIEKFSSYSARYFNYQTMESTRQLVEKNGLKVLRIYCVNERERWGMDKRDLDWVYCFINKQ